MLQTMCRKHCKQPETDSFASGGGGSPPQRKVCETLKQSNRNRKLSGGEGGGPDPSAERTKNSKQKRSLGDQS